MIIDLSPNVQYKRLQKIRLQEMCRDIYRRIEPLGVEKGNTVAAIIIGEDVIFEEQKRTSCGDFLPAGTSKAKGVFVDFICDPSGKCTGEYLHYWVSRFTKTLRGAERLRRYVTVCSDSRRSRRRGKL